MNWDWQVTAGSTKAVPERSASEASKKSPRLVRVGEAGEAGFAVGVGADFEVELVRVHESVGDVDFDFGGVDGGARGIGDGEVGGAGSDAAVDDGRGFRVGGCRSLCAGRER